jgi:ABC-type amino acid transport substrate-binding protein
MTVLALVGSHALQGDLRLRAPRVLRYAFGTAGLLAASVFTLAVVLRGLGGGAYEGGRLAAQLGLLLPASQGATVLAALPEEPLPAPRAGTPLLEAVRARGRLRVAFVPGQAPYSHVNARGELVGFDVEMAHALGRELGVAVEFAPVPRDRIFDALDAGRVDVVMAGILVTTLRASRATFSAPYLDETLSFLVPDHRRSDFADAAWVRAQPGLRIGVPDLPYFEQLVAREFPGARIVSIPLAEVESYLQGRVDSIDALALTAERGSFFTLLHPAYSVAVPHPLEIRVPLGYPVARHDVEAARFLSTWIDLKKKDGTIRALYDHWIRGQDAQAAEPRWSILRNVLGYGR